MMEIQKNQRKSVLLYIELAGKEVTLTPGKRKALTGKVYPAYAQDISLSWTSSKPEVAAVDAKGM